MSHTWTLEALSMFTLFLVITAKIQNLNEDSVYSKKNVFSIYSCIRINLAEIKLCVGIKFHDTNFEIKLISLNA